jgi:UTP--glucose-1-phosphate uridylyltransferase
VLIVRRREAQWQARHEYARAEVFVADLEWPQLPGHSGYSGLTLRASPGASPLLLMNSAVTRSHAELLGRYPTLQPSIVRTEASGRRLPATSWPADEWNGVRGARRPTRRFRIRMLQALLDAGLRWCFVSNVDNLGALVDPRIAA